MLLKFVSVITKKEITKEPFETFSFLEGLSITSSLFLFEFSVPLQILLPQASFLSDNLLSCTFFPRSLDSFLVSGYSSSFVVSTTRNHLGSGHMFFFFSLNLDLFETCMCYSSTCFPNLWLYLNHIDFRCCLNLFFFENFLLSRLLVIRLD